MSKENSCGYRSWLVHLITLLGTNISTQGMFEDDVPFPVWWDMLFPWRVPSVSLVEHPRLAFQIDAKKLGSPAEAKRGCLQEPFTPRNK